MNSLLVLGFLTLYFTLIITRPQMGTVLACALFAWYGWQEIAHGSVAGVLCAAWCIALHAGIPLMADASLSPARTRKV